MPANEENKKILHPSSPNAKRRRNEALKTVVNSRSQPGPHVTSTTTTSRPVTKQRQLLAHPKTLQKGIINFIDINEIISTINS
ncbi:unnamed protein product [Wuchereria bancrofti]|uniref:Uncharacterized protein n=1 Tax=Wuchereria bancrofti TaxID=6293 RepID=A0A3P7G4R7_WUCBA|nr:unnamed protein product [Wuchereria bancrofti]